MCGSSRRLGTEAPDNSRRDEARGRLVVAGPVASHPERPTVIEEFSFSEGSTVFARWPAQVQGMVAAMIECLRRQ